MSKWQSASGEVFQVIFYSTWRYLTQSKNNISKLHIEMYVKVKHFWKPYQQSCFQETSHWKRVFNKECFPYLSRRLLACPTSSENGGNYKFRICKRNNWQIINFVQCVRAEVLAQCSYMWCVRSFYQSFPSACRFDLWFYTYKFLINILNISFLINFNFKRDH